jgi:hypothetical protein
MSHHPPPLFDSSVAALSLINPSSLEDSGSVTGKLSRKPGTWGATAMPIQFAPEPNPTANIMDLKEEQATGARPLGFEFEFFGIRYSWFDVSSDGFITLAIDSSSRSDSAQAERCIPINADLSNFIALGSVDVVLAGPRRIAYEVRGTAHRRRLVLSFTRLQGAADGEVLGATAQVILYERTGMIDVHTKRREADGLNSNEAAVRLTTSPRCANGVAA